MRKNVHRISRAGRVALVVAASAVTVMGSAGTASADTAQVAGDISVVEYTLGGKALPVRVTGDASALAGRFYGWEDNDYSGDRWIDVGQGECSGDRCEIDWWDGDNEISSVSNESTCKVRLFANDGWDGTFYDVGAGVDKPKLSLVGFDNQAESLEFIC